MKNFWIGVGIAAAIIGSASEHAFGHSHYPSEYGGPKDPINAITFSQVAVVPVTVGNLNDYPQAYEITLDENVIGVVPEISSMDSRVLMVPVRLDKPNIPEIHQICSVSVVGDDATFRTRICTTARLYWKKDETISTVNTATF